MLPARHRLRDAAQFRAAVRGPRGARSGGTFLVIHAAMTDPERRRAPRVGFVVSKAVGNAAVRNRVTRRLRAIAGAELGGIPPGVDVVMRALPGAAGASFADMEGEATRLLGRSVRAAARAGTGSATSIPAGGMP